MITSNSPLGTFLKFLRGGHYPVIPLLVICIFVTLAIFGETIAPYPPNEIDLAARFSPPFWQKGGSISHFLGTDALGRDILSRIVVGARVSFIVAVLALALGGGVGTMLGIVSGYYGGKVDSILIFGIR